MDSGIPVNIANLPETPVQVDERGRVLLSIREVEVAKLDLKPGQVLAITVKCDDLDEYALDCLKASLTKIFPNNKIALFGLRPGDGMEFSVISQEEAVSYCSDCSCGKKEKLMPLPLSPEAQKVVDDFNDEYNLRANGESDEKTES